MQSIRSVVPSAQGVVVAVQNVNVNLAGHVFPEFKESDAMFAAERVSVWIGEGEIL